MSMNEKAIVGETLDDPPDKGMAMLTGFGDAEPYSLPVVSAVSVSLEPSRSYSVVLATLTGNRKRQWSQSWARSS